MSSGIYVIKNNINNKTYIGSAVNLSARKARHYYDLKRQKHHNIVLQRAYDKYGKNNLEFHIIEIVDNKDELKEVEQWWIDNTNPEYNICKDANSQLGVKHSEESKCKRSKRMQGNTYSVGKRHGIKNLIDWTGKKQSDEHIQKRRKQIIKPVAQIDIITGEIIKVWDSVTSAATSLNLDKSTLVKVCKGKRNHTGGYKWEYTNG